MAILFLSLLVAAWTVVVDATIEVGGGGGGGGGGGERKSEGVFLLSCRQDLDNDDLLECQHVDGDYDEVPSYDSITSTSTHRPVGRILRVLRDVEDDSTSDPTFVAINVTGAVVCIVFVALIASMFLGYLTLEPLDLRVKIRASIDPDERRYARKLLPVVQEHHRLLVTLLLMNAIFYETLPLFLDNILPSWAAIVLSVTILLVFGEIVTSAIITGPNQLKLASQMTPILHFSLWALYPVAWPLTKLLDYLVPGEHGNKTNNDVVEETYHRGELSALVRIQYEDRQRHAMPPHTLSTPAASALQQQQRRRSSGASSHSPTRRPQDYSQELPPRSPPPLHSKEVKLVEGALGLTTKCALDVYTPERMLFMVRSDLELNQGAIAKVYAQGYSRVPVYIAKDDDSEDDDRSAIVGILMTRQLILIDWTDRRPVSSLPLYDAPCVSPRMNLVHLLQILQQGRSNLALVCTNPDAAASSATASASTTDPSFLTSAPADMAEPLPQEAGFIGIVTLEDVMEAILQDSIYDEEDITARDLAGARLTQWWRTRKRRKKGKDKGRRKGDKKNSVPALEKASEDTPLLHK